VGQNRCSKWAKSDARTQSARRSVYCSKHAKGQHSIAKGFCQRRGQHLVRTYGALVGKMASAPIAEQASKLSIVAKGSKPTRSVHAH
jgi:hypothetical protein